MSFGYSAGELLGFAQLAWKIVQNSRRACGEHHGLTREVKSLHSALKRLERDASEAESAEASTTPTNSKDLKRAIRGCVRVLRELDGILEKYSSLSERELSVKKLLSKVRFGNSEMQELNRFRIKISTYLGIIMLHINVSTGSEMRKMKVSIDGIAARLASGCEGSILTSYGDDDKAAWKELRRELHKEGFEDSFIRGNRDSIMEYVRDLGDRGVFDEAGPSVLVGGSVDEVIIGNRPEAEDCKEEDVMSGLGDDEEAVGASVDETIQEKGPMIEDCKEEDATSALGEHVEAAGPAGASVDTKTQEQGPETDDCKEEDAMSTLGDDKEAVGASVDQTIQEKGPETGDCKEEDAMSSLGDDEEALHGGEGQPSTEPQGPASNSAELIQVEEVEKQMEPTDHTAEKPSRCDGLGSQGSHYHKVTIDIFGQRCHACRKRCRGPVTLLACNHIWCHPCLEEILLKAAFVHPYIRPSCCTGAIPITITGVFPDGLRRGDFWRRFSLISKLSAQVNRGLVQPRAKAEESFSAVFSQHAFDEAAVWALWRQDLVNKGFVDSYIEENKKWIWEYFQYLFWPGPNADVAVWALKEKGFTIRYIEENLLWMLDIVENPHKAGGTASR